MEANRFLCGMTLVTAFVTGPLLAAQVQTEVPPVISGAKPVTFEGIEVRGTALEGNLEGNAVARDVIVFLPPSYAKEKSRRASVSTSANFEANLADSTRGRLRIDAGKLHDVLDRYGIANSFEVYQGTQTSKVADRFQNRVIPFFSQNLCFQAGCR